MKATLLACLDVIVAVIGSVVIRLVLPAGDSALPTMGNVAFILAFIALCRQHKNGGAE